MQVIRSTNLNPVNAVGLARRSLRVAPNLGCMGCNGMAFFPGFDDMLQGALNIIKNAFRVGSGRDAHIPAQNAAVENMGTIVSAYQSLKQQGLLSETAILQAQSGIQQIAQEFEKVARQFGTQRALQGAKDVNALATRIINDMEQDKIPLGITPGIPSPVGSPTGGGPVILPTAPSGLAPILRQSSQSYLPWILAGGFLLIVATQSKKW